MLWISHRWAGLLAGLFLALLGLSGSALVFRDAWEKRRSGVRLHWDAALPRATLQRVVDEAQRAHPQGRIVIVNLREPVEVVVFEQGVSRLLAFDPVSAREMGPLRRPGGVMSGLARLHGSFALGKRGRDLVGASGVVLALLSLSGLVLFARRRQSWHARFGLWCCAPLLLISISGSMMIWWRPAYLPPPRVEAAGEAGWSTADQWVKAAASALPGGQPSYLNFPFNRNAPVTVRVRLRGDLREQGAHDVHLDPATSRVLRIDRLEEGPWSRRLYMNLAAFHFGEFGGWPVRWLWVALGLTPAALWLSGFLLWSNRRRTATRSQSPPRSR